MQQTCATCSAPFEITDDDLKFYEKVSPMIAGKKYSIPPPTRCPDCRQQRRLLFCNEFTFYPAVCGLCKAPIITEFHPGQGFPIYCRSCYLTDKWNPLSCGQEVDFSRPFFEQMQELFMQVPHQNLSIDGETHNSNYIHYAGTCKNCYLIMHADFCEDSYYGYGLKNNRFCVDGFYNLYSELCYDCIDVHTCYGLTCCQDCKNCYSSAFLRDCIGCRDCFLCTGLRQKQYFFENEQLTKEEYEKRISQIDPGSYTEYQKYKKRRNELELQHTFKEFQGTNTQNCVGNYLQNCKNAFWSFDCEDAEDVKYCTQLVLGAKNNYDIYQYGTNLQESYNSAISGENSYHILFCNLNYQQCSELTYCTVMDGCHNCFGCTNLRTQSYCILNKKYSKTEYEKLIPKIIQHMEKTGEWGEFLPPYLAHCGYNESTAQVYYPLSKEQAHGQGFQWYDGESPPPKSEKIIQASDLPDNIKDTPDDICNWAIKCERTGKLFKLTIPEYQFYKKNNLPIPRKYWYQRHLDRFAQRNPRRFWYRKCDKCGKQIQTTYAPERPETVYCESCYLKNVY